ncbi:hypothetical protein D3C80_1300550 [compost metagenome]
MLPQGQLQGSLQVALVLQLQPLQATQAAEQALVDQYVVAAWVAIAEFFQVGADQAVVARVAPMLQGAVQPGAVHRLGGCHLLQEPQRLGAVGKEPAWRTLPPLGQVASVALSHLGGMPRAPGW